MKLFKNIYQIYIFCLLFLTAFFAVDSSHCATDGVTGTTSTGLVDIQITLDEQVQISELDDIILTNWPGSGNLQGYDDLCVYSNTSGGGYSVTATGSGGGSRFEVNNGGNKVDYNAYWNDISGTNSGMQQLTKSTALTGQSGADTSSLSCNNGANLTSRVIIEFLEADLTAAASLVYTGTLTLVIAPE